MDLGRMALDTNTFTALVTNTDSTTRVLGLTLRASPGLWVRGNWQRGYRFEIRANSKRIIQASYVFIRMTPEARLRVAFGQPTEGAGGIYLPAPFFDTTLTVGVNNPSASDPRSSFDTLHTAHLDLFAWHGSRSARQLRAIAASRERAIKRIAELLDVPFTGRVRLVFYPDSATKTRQTGHIGAGFASSGTIVEIFNDSIQLDPYHEITHIVAAELGAPPAVLNEGFAVYISEQLGADALKYLGSRGKTVSQAICAAQREQRLIPLIRLFRFTEIGPDSTMPTVSYPEAASIVAFLVRRYGMGRFRELYRRLGNSSSPNGEEILLDLYGVTIGALDSSWRAQLTCGSQ